MEKLTKEQANIEAKKIYDEWNKEVEKIKNNAIDKGKWQNIGLDTNRHLFKKANEKAKRKLDELKLRVKE